MFKCLECGRLFKTTKAAERALNHGCPKCGGSDLDAAPLSESKTVFDRHREKIARENARMPAPLAAVMNA